MNDLSGICNPHGRLRCGDCIEREGLVTDITELRAKLALATEALERITHDEWEVISESTGMRQSGPSAAAQIAETARAKLDAPTKPITDTRILQVTYFIGEDDTQRSVTFPHESKNFRIHYALSDAEIESAQLRVQTEKTSDTLMSRSTVSVHGTDACRKCDTGRVTIYAASRWCVECLHKMQTEKGSAR